MDAGTGILQTEFQLGQLVWPLSLGALRQPGRLEGKSSSCVLPVSCLFLFPACLLTVSCLLPVGVAGAHPSRGSSFCDSSRVQFSVSSTHAGSASACVCEEPGAGGEQRRPEVLSLQDPCAALTLPGGALQSLRHPGAHEVLHSACSLKGRHG